MAPFEFSRARSCEEKLYIVVLDEPLDFIEERGNFLHFIDHHEARMVPEPVTKMCGAGCIYCEDIGVEEVNHRRIRKMMSDPVGFPDLPRTPEECRSVPWEVQLKHPPDNFTHDLILS